MRFLTFDYVDAAGKHSHREVIELSAPQPHHFCVDVVELEPIEQGMLLAELQIVYDDFLKLREGTLKKYDVAKNYRYFKPENITNLRIEEE